MFRFEPRAVNVVKVLCKHLTPFGICSLSVQTDTTVYDVVTLQKNAVNNGMLFVTWEATNFSKGLLLVTAMEF